MANELGSQKLVTRESCENWLSEFFDKREASFYKRGIMKLASRWELLIEQKGDIWLKSHYCSQVYEQLKIQ